MYVGFVRGGKKPTFNGFQVNNIVILLGQSGDAD